MASKKLKEATHVINHKKQQYNNMINMWWMRWQFPLKTWWVEHTNYYSCKNSRREVSA